MPRDFHLPLITRHFFGTDMHLTGKKVLLILSGSIAAPKALRLMDLLRGKGALVSTILTSSAREFVSVEEIITHAGAPPHISLFRGGKGAVGHEEDLDHIFLTRRADLVVVAPATAHMLAKMALGFADDLASAALLACNKPVIVVPAMNPQMWAHPATRRNIAILENDGVRILGPVVGDTACGEAGLGRMMEPEEIFAEIERFFEPKPLAGRKTLVTAGPTREKIDPVRYISNASSGRQGYAVAEALAEAGADVTLISGPVELKQPPGVKELIKIESACDMRDAVKSRLPADVAVCAAAVADWRVLQPSTGKLKKESGPPDLKLAATPDILAEISKSGKARPRLVIGFALESENLESNARTKIKAKGCDWMVANQADEAIASADNRISLLTRDPRGGIAFENWPRMSKRAVAERLVARIAEEFKASG